MRAFYHTQILCSNRGKIRIDALVKSRRHLDDVERDYDRHATDGKSADESAYQRTGDDKSVPESTQANSASIAFSHPEMTPESKPKRNPPSAAMTTIYRSFMFMAYGV